MILIDFKVDEDELAGDLEEDIANEDYSLLYVSYFIFPARIQINGVDIFEYKGKVWSSTPIMGLASGCLTLIKELKETKEDKLIMIEGPGDIYFKMIDDNHVEIKYDYIPPKKEFIVPYDELLEAFKKFVEKFRKFMWERVPQLNDHPYWGAWMRGNID